MPFKNDKVRKEKQREYSRRWYLKNTAHARQRSAKNKRDTRRKWLEYKMQQACAKCGFSHPAVIDFHHVIRHGKRSVNDLAVSQNNVSEAIREAEEKCIPLCANCHRILHFNERQVIKARRKKK